MEKFYVFNKLADFLFLIIFFIKSVNVTDCPYFETNQHLFFGFFGFFFFLSVLGLFIRLYSIWRNRLSFIDHPWFEIPLIFNEICLLTTVLVTLSLIFETTNFEGVLIGIKFMSISHEVFILYDAFARIEYHPLESLKKKIVIFFAIFISTYIIVQTILLTFYSPKDGMSKDILITTNGLFFHQAKNQSCSTWKCEWIFENGVAIIESVDKIIPCRLKTIFKNNNHLIFFKKSVYCDI